MVLRTETYKDGDGVERVKSYYGYIDNNGKEVIKGTSDVPVPTPKSDVDILTPEEQQNAKIDYIMATLT